MARVPKQKEKPKLLRSVNGVLEFGKHKGKTIAEIMKTDSNWLHWALQNIPDFKLNKNALLLLPAYREREPDEDEEQAFRDSQYCSDIGSR
jgi:hypothetical protein